MKLKRWFKKFVLLPLMAVAELLIFLFVGLLVACQYNKLAKRITYYVVDNFPQPEWYKA